MMQVVRNKCTGAPKMHHSVSHAQHVYSLISSGLFPLRTIFSYTSCTKRTDKWCIFYRQVVQKQPRKWHYLTIILHHSLSKPYKINVKFHTSCAGNTTHYARLLHKLHENDPNWCIILHRLHRLWFISLLTLYPFIGNPWCVSSTGYLWTTCGA